MSLRTAKYYIYRNLNRGTTFSVKYRGKVIVVGENIVAHGVRFQVSAAGRTRVLRDRKRNVHAFAVADRFEQPDSIDTSSLTTVSYNPYKAPNFRMGDIDIFDAPRVMFTGGKCYVNSESAT